MEQKERPYVSPEAVQRSLDHVALERGLTREELDREIEQFSSEPPDGEHLGYLEILDIQTLPSNREEHLRTCERCRGLVDAFYPPDYAASAFREAVGRQLADPCEGRTVSVIPTSRRKRYAIPTTIAACMALGMMAAFYLDSKDRSRASLSVSNAAVDALASERRWSASSPNSNLSREDLFARTLVTSQKEDLRIKGADTWAWEGVKAVNGLALLSQHDPSPRVRERAAAGLAKISAIGEAADTQSPEATTPKVTEPKTEH